MKLDTTAKQLFFTTIRIEGRNSDGQTWNGTGFLFNASSSEDGIMPLLISNKHVVADDAVELKLHFVEGDSEGMPVAGGDIEFVVDRPRELVVQHGDKNVDVAMLPIAPILRNLKQQGKNPVFRLLDKSQVVSDEEFGQLDAYQDIAFVGYPSGLYDQLNLTPMLRRGSTATPLQLDYNDTPTFVIDAAVYGGSSGSPVMILNIGSYRDSSGTHFGGDRVVLLGVLAAVHLSRQEGRLVPVSSPDVLVDIPNGLGLVYKWAVVEHLIDEYCGSKGIVR